MEIGNEIRIWQEEICINDCQKSFTKLFNLLYPRLFEISKFFVKQGHVAEEVVMDVFMKFWSNRKNLFNVQDLKGYLFIAVKRQSLNALRDSKKRILFVNDAELITLVSPKYPEDDLFSEEFLSFLAACISRLPEKCRIVFKLVKEENLKYKEVADILNISEKTVEMHMSHALKQLRNDLSRLDKHAF